MNKNKKCSTCEQYRPVDRFFKDKKAKDGLRSECKRCTHEKRIMNAKRILEGRGYVVQYVGN